MKGKTEPVKIIESRRCPECSGEIGITTKPNGNPDHGYCVDCLKTIPLTVKEKREYGSKR